MKLCPKLPKPIQEFQESTFRLFRAHGLDTVSCCILAYLAVQIEESTLDNIAKHTEYSFEMLLCE